MTTVIDIVDNQRVKYRPVHNELAAEAMRGLVVNRTGCGY